MRVLWAALLLVAISLAGCVGEDEPAPTPGNPSTSTANTAPAPTAVKKDAVPVNAVPQVVAPKPYSFPIKGSGTAAQGAWVCDHPRGAYECNGHEVSQNQNWLEFEYPDRLTGGEIVLTWERADVTYYKMVGVVTITPVGGEPQIVTIGEDPSPLTMKLYDLDLAPGTIKVETWGYSETGSDGAYVFVDAQAQDFQLGGTLTLLPAAPVQA